MIKIPHKYATLIIGILLWTVYRIEMEFSFYNIYSIFSYSAHEIIVFIPFILIIATIIWLIIDVRNQLKYKNTKIGHRFSLLLFVVLFLQFIHLYNISQTVSTFTVAKIIEIDHEKGTMMLETSNLDKTYQFVVQAEGFILNTFEPGVEEYGISYEYKNYNPDIRKVSTITYRPMKETSILD